MASKRAFPILDDELAIIRERAAAPGAVASSVAKEHAISMRTLGRIVDRTGPYSEKIPAPAAEQPPVSPEADEAAIPEPGAQVVDGSLEETSPVIAQAAETIVATPSPVAAAPTQQPGGLRGILSRLFGFGRHEVA